MMNRDMKRNMKKDIILEYQFIYKLKRLGVNLDLQKKK